MHMQFTAHFVCRFCRIVAFGCALLLTTGSFITPGTAQMTMERRDDMRMERRGVERDIGIGVGIGIGQALIQQGTQPPSNDPVSRQGTQSKKKVKQTKHGKDGKDEVKSGKAGGKDVSDQGGKAPPQGDSKLSDENKASGIAGEKGGGVPPAYKEPPHINETAERDDHYYAGLSGCDQCELRCKKQSTGQPWPDCKQGTLRNRKEKLLKTLVLTDGKLYVKIEVNQEICNTVSCHSYGNAIASPAVGLKICCTYKQWQSDSYTSWASPITDANGLVTSYKLDTSTPCSCGQIYEAALDAQLADGTYGRTKFVGAVEAVCPNLPLEGLEDFVKSCKFFGSDVKVGGVDWNNLMNTAIGHLGASKGESGPGWSYPNPPKVPAPEAKPGDPGLGGPPPK